MISIRVFYTKLSRAKYISHLDIARCMQRAIKRSGLPIWYTEGFNPHIYISFALPLSLGYESEYETMDMKLEQDERLGEVGDKLNAALPPDIRVVRVAVQQKKPQTIASALYQVRLYGDNTSAAELREKFEAFFAQPQILVDKRAKNGRMNQIDLKSDCRIEQVEEQSNGIQFLLTTPAGNQRNINPSLLTDAFLAGDSAALHTAVLRKKVFCEDGTLFE